MAWSVSPSSMFKCSLFSVVLLTVFIVQLYAEEPETDSDDSLATIRSSPFFHREPRWRGFAFRSFEHMDSSVFRDYKYGFPPGIYGSSVIPLTIWYHLWGPHTVEGKLEKTDRSKIGGISFNSVTHALFVICRP